MILFCIIDGGLLLGLLAASAVSAAGSIYANRQNLKQQKSVNQQAIELADTAHQREVADLYAAGLNPVLSATGNGASVPSLGVANQDNVLSSFGHNARSIGEAISKNRSLTNESIKADIGKTVADTDASIATAKNLAKQNDNLVKQNAEIDARIRNIDADTMLKEKEMGSRSGVGKAYEDVKSIAKDVPNVLDKSGVQLNRAGFLEPVNSAKRFVRPESSTPGYSMPRRSRPRGGNGWRFRKPDNLGN